MEFWKYFLCTILYINVVLSQVTKDIEDNAIDAIKPKGRSAIKAATQDNRKPMFRDCETYKPSVPEERDRGTDVITVKAYDDDPPELGGIVTYQIVKREGERVSFRINETSGQIVTEMPFDRDEPGRVKERYLTVQATDNGRPPLADICTFKITITDINDNAPTFDQLEYNSQVAEDLKVNSEVMRVFAYDIDDGENSRLTYSFAINDPFEEYFLIDNATGVIYLKKTLATQRARKFQNTVTARDNGQSPLQASADISILVVGSEKQSPKILSVQPSSTIELDENFNDFAKTLVTIEANSNINDPEVVFELIKGRTSQTNKDQTFILTPTSENTAELTLVRQLDYETITEYKLTIRVKNKDQMDTSTDIIVNVRDVNDETPNFIELLKGSVGENEPPGVQAMQVKAIDKDGTAAHNNVSYELQTHLELFEIDRYSGKITSKVQFDREENNLYHVRVRAYDNSPSALKKDSKEPNSVIQDFQITIDDKNDNDPKFERPTYVFDKISETTDISVVVGEVRAVDKDAAADIKYTIIDGNVGDAFDIETSTGRIKIKNKLDYEKIESYNLTVRAFDGIYQDTAEVYISILNENDEPPVFKPFDKNITLLEEKIPEGCIIHLEATDPDIKDETKNQEILYVVEDKNKEYFGVDSNGCVTLKMPLDRDKPLGTPTRQVYIYAYDNNGSQNALNSYAEIIINLEDINDNAPFLTVTEVVWGENKPAGEICTLQADDYDSPENGPPFTFDIAFSATDEITTKFSIIGDKLFAITEFDREFKKYYDVPITISDNGKPQQSATSILRVIIGDENDNPAKDGSSEIFVYKYKGLQLDMNIGRVYVDDLDDWDLNDKIFVQQDEYENFGLNSTDRGMIVMKSHVLPGTYNLNFEVTEYSELIPEHTVYAKVAVTVKEIIEEAVRKSGSIRLKGSSIEDFVEKQGETHLSKKDLLRDHIAKILNTSRDNVDVFTVLQSPFNNSLVDVRFSAHGSPYYAPEKLNNIATEYQTDLESKLGVSFVMISISECLNETVCAPASSCSNKLTIKDEPAVVFTNKTSFVGVKAIVEADCNCNDRQPTECFNNGTLIEDHICSCPAGFEGPYCESLSIGFTGDGWAMYPTFDACNNSAISLSILPQSDNGLIFYVGPSTLRHAGLSKDFLSLELKDGYLILMLDFGGGIVEIPYKHKKLSDGALHKINIFYTTNDVRIEVDDCKKSDCIVWEGLNQKNILLNVNGPLQIGGMKNQFNDEESKMIWQHLPPTKKGFSGCIRNFTYNHFWYNLGSPSDQFHAYPQCNYGIAQAVTFGIDSNFLVAILVCIAILIILLLAVVIHRKKQDNLNEKEIDDTRENIINYEDEGGGEYDANFDLTVFPHNGEEKKLIPKDTADVPADISRFLDNKKDTCDKDPENLPYDDVRHYAYEGDGNSTGSLSSLASVTDEGDLNINLSSFGPRFRKLADMYGEDPSDDESQNGGEESWC